MPGTILKQLTSTGQPDGTTATAANTGFTLLQPGTSNTAQHKDAAKMGQPMGVRLTQASANQNIGYLDLDSAVAVFAWRLPLKFGALPTTSVQIGRWYPAVDHITNLGTLTLQSTGRVGFSEATAGGLSLTSPSGTPLSSVTDYVLEGLIDCTANTFAINCYTRGATSALWSMSGATVTDMATTAGIASMRFGIANSGTAVNTAVSYVDTNTGFAIGSGDYLARHDVAANLTATVSVSPSSGPVGTVVNATVTATGGNGNPISYSVNWGDGQTTGPQSSNTFSHTYSSAGTFNGTATATQAA
jgi:hypothetical protein